MKQRKVQPKGFTGAESKPAKRFRDQGEDKRDVWKLLPPESLPVALFRSKDDIVSLGKANIEALIALWRNEEEAKFVLDQIKSLRVLQRGAGARPLLPEFRRDDYFALSNEMIVFSASQNNVFCRSKIKSIFERKVELQHEKVLTVDDESADTRIIGKSVIMGFYRPEVLTKTDFEYLLRNPAYTRIWIRISKQDVSEVRDAQFNAMAVEATRRGYPGKWDW